MRRFFELILVCLIPALLFAACKNETMTTGIPTENFGNHPSGDEVQLFTLSNSNGLEAKITNYGATVVSLKTPDKNGELIDILLGFDNLDGYIGEHPFFGCVVGRYGNRIAKGKFTLSGEEYTLATNNGPNHLHGGVEGFGKKVWKTESTFQNETGEGVTFSLISPDGEEGYPGTLSMKVTYTLTPNNELDIDYEATTDKATVVNLTNHMYFNLKDGGASDILSHQLMLNADRFTPVDSTLIPTGELAEVAGTAFDFLEYHTIGERIDAEEEQIGIGKGYDHNFVLRGEAGSLSLIAKVLEPESGRLMEVYTTEPGVQFYSGNFLDGTVTGKGKTYQNRSGLCLETQHFPDSPNQENFPSVTLNPEEKYQTKTRYSFGVSE